MAPPSSDLKQPLLQNNHENHEKSGPASTSSPSPSSSYPSSTTLPPPAVDYYSQSNFFSHLFFNFGSPLLKAGNQRLLTVQDLPAVPSVLRSEVLVSQFFDVWESQKKRGRKQSIIRALASCFWRDILTTGILALLKGIGTLSGPIFLYFFVDYTSGNVRFENEGIILVIALLLVKIVENFSQRHWYFGVRILGCKLQSTMMGAIYQKELRLSSVGRKHYTTGEIVNFISVDTYRLCEFAWRLHWAWLVVVVLFGALGISFAVVGWATLPALVLIVAVLVLLTPMIKSMQTAQKNFMTTQDERLRATSEVLQGMKVIKLQAWEEKFDEFIHQKRDQEFKWLGRTSHVRNIITIIYWLMPTVLTCVVLAACLVVDIALTSTVVFTVLAIFRIIQDPIKISPEVYASMIQAQVSFQRLEKFLLEEELPMEAVLGGVDNFNRTSEYVVRVDNASFSWNPDETPVKPSLHNVNVVAKYGEKVAVCGAVGSGKSSFLLALLGEIPKLSGSVQLSGTIAYVPQSAWIQTMTVRDNILFGKPYDSVRYRQAIRACALEEDIKGFSHGDLTEIGERGINMSGGQKQRIQLARAVYNDADIYVLDDPFSAVDAQTASILFHDCVMGALKQKTVVLVTHQIEFLPSVDTILVMQNGEIKQAGTYNDLLHGGHAFQQLVSAHEEALHSVGDDNVVSKVGAIKKVNISEEGVESQFRKIQKRLSREESLSEKGPEQSTQLVQDELTESGRVGLKPYISYVMIPKSYIIVAVLVLSQVAFSGASLYSNLWLANGVSNSAVSSELLVGVYGGFSLLCVIFFALRSYLIVVMGLRSSKTFFTRLMTSIMKAPMSFFDATPSGRILNRASVDMSVVDLDIPFSIATVLGTILDVICIVVVTCIVTWPIIFVVVPVLIYTQYLQRYYESAARELNRINSTTKAPIVNNCAETMSGSAAIRAFRQAERFRKRNLALIDRDCSAYIYKFGILEWMVVRIELSCNLVLVVAAALVLFLGNVSGGMAGLAVTYAIALGSCLVVFTIFQCFLAIFVVSVERIKQYMELPKEAPPVIESNRPPAQWPTKGEIILDHLKIRYREHSPLVLKGITCTFHGGQKIGVVGRTGSGKTTLISALFRLVEPASGKICIDNVDITSIGLHDLRFKLGIIPQEPVLFQGTVRTNLDPLNQYTDFQVWESLRKSQLADVIESLPHRLESPVSDQGENWSAGQRQLFCLGRVLLKQSRVLVLDEATASIDSATDALLQKVIREEFTACTVVTVAHRIPTVIDSDMVLSLRDGIAMEFDSPRRLIDQKTSLFAQLVAEYWAQAGRKSASSDAQS